MTAYDNKCCVTGLAIPQLLVAGHIIPWSVDESLRLNTQNGLSLNMLYDKAFDRGLMWIDEDYYIHYSKDFKEHQKADSVGYDWMKQFEGRQLLLPKDFHPSVEYLLAHKKGSWR